MATLTKAELAGRLTDSLGINRREAAEMVDAFYAEIVDALASGEEVKLSGFGGFALRDKAARPGRNPKTGEPAMIESRRVVTFHASPKLKSAVDVERKRRRVSNRRRVALDRGAGENVVPTMPSVVSVES